MSLTDLMSHAGLADYAQIALVLFCAAFVAIVIRTFAPGNKREMEQVGRLPLEDATQDTAHEGVRP